MHTANKKTNISHGGATCTSICLLWADYITTNINLLITYNYQSPYQLRQNYIFHVMCCTCTVKYNYYLY